MGRRKSAVPLNADDILQGRQWTVLTGDCLGHLQRLADQSIDVVITDPPYSAHVHAKNRRMLRGSGGHISARRAASGKTYGAGIPGLVPITFQHLDEDTQRAAADHFARLVRRWCVVFSDGESTHLWREHLERAGLRHIRKGYWWKRGAQPQLSGDRPAAAVEELEIASAEIVGVSEIEIAHPIRRTRWNHGGHAAIYVHRIATDNNGKGDRVHETQKPLSLMLDLVHDFTEGPRRGWCGGVIGPGEVVLDPFCGGGSTGVACLREGRRFIGIEKNPKMAAIATEVLAAAERGLGLGAARAGQASLFDFIQKPAGC